MGDTTKTLASSRTRSIAQVALCIAIMAVCAWVTVPLGPVPFTLQTFAVAFAILALRPGEAVAATAGYLVLGAVGLPVFSGMRGGIGMLAGPTGGFLWGFLAGAVATGMLMAIFMSNAGGAWDNAKKYIEQGHHGGKGSEAHKAAVVGDTVGDPFKDTSGPSMNILINLMTIVSLTFAPLFIMIQGLF